MTEGTPNSEVIYEPDRINFEISADRHITKMFNSNLYPILCDIFSYLHGDDIFNLLMAIEETTFLNSNWHATQKSENSLIWNNIKQKRLASLEDMKQNSGLQLTVSETESLLALLTNADYRQLMQHTIDHKKTDDCEEFTLVLPEFTNEGAQMMWLNDNLLAVLSYKRERYELLEDGSCKIPPAMATVLLYDRRTLQMVNGISMRRESLEILLPKAMTSDDGSVFIRCYDVTGTTGTRDLILWDALRTSRVLCWSMSTRHLDASNVYYVGTEDAHTYSLATRVFLETKYGMACRRKMFENNEGHRLEVERFKLDEEAESLSGPNKTAWLVDGNQFYCVAGLLKPIRHVNEYFLQVCQIRSKDDFSLLKTIHVKCSSTEDPSTSGFKISSPSNRDTGVIYLLGDRFLITGNSTDSSFEVRSIEDMSLVHVFNQNKPGWKDNWITAKVENGFLLAQYANSLHGSFLAVWRLSKDLLERCDRCLETGTVGFTDLLWLKEIGNLCFREGNGLQIDDSGVSHYCFSQSDYVETGRVKMTNFRLPSEGQIWASSEIDKRTEKTIRQGDILVFFS